VNTTSHDHHPQSNPISIPELLELLGKQTVFIKWPLGSKGTKRQWGNLTIAHMTPAYLKSVAGGNVGVALGEKSGNLIALDVDNDEMVAPFIAANPILKATLQTHGARGRVFWLRMAGIYPPKTKKLKNQSGEDCGEFRSNGSQSIIYGKHPSGKAYEVMNRAKPFTVDFASIVWPQEISNPPILETRLAHTGTEEPEDTEDTEEPEESEEVLAWLFFVHSVEDVLRVSKPSSPHQNYPLALVLARGVKALEAQRKKPFSPEEHQDIHNRWIMEAAPFLRPGQSKGDYFMEYLNAYRLAKYPLGSLKMGQALHAAKQNPLPPDALTWTENPEIRVLAALCRELQKMEGEKPFFLSARTVQTIFKHPSHAIGARWLRSFCVMGILTEIEKGKGFKASRYRYCGPVETTHAPLQSKKS
jgi:hypothetical protein